MISEMNTYCRLLPKSSITGLKKGFRLHGRIRREAQKVISLSGMPMSLKSSSETSESITIGSPMAK